MVIPTVRQLLRSQCIHQSATTLRTLASELSNTDYFVRMAPINRWDYLALGSNEPDGLKGEKCKKEKKSSAWTKVLSHGSLCDKCSWKVEVTSCQKWPEKGQLGKGLAPIALEGLM